MALCPSCQAQIPGDAKFCPSCGFQIAVEEAPTATHWSIPQPPDPASRGSRSSGSDGIDTAATQEQVPIGQSIPPGGAVPNAPTVLPGASRQSFRSMGGRGPGTLGQGIFSAGAAPGGAAAPPQGMSMSSSSIATGRFQPGMILADRYRIVGQLGKGGMGEVFRADDMKLAQPVALKFLPEHLSGNAQSMDRMLNEVRVARAVSHANVCRVHDIGEIDGMQFLSMEYVDGEDLASLLRRIGRLPSDKALQISRQICAGLAAAHDKGVLHRDLKPANVMLDGRGSVRITDFGLAGLAAELRGQAGRAGTPAYMAPEQFAGQGVTVKSDIYALGLVLYEIFTGKPVYRPESMEHLAKLHGSPPPSASAVVPDIDPKIERVILRCLEKDPMLRPSSALAVSAALPGGDPLAEALAAGETPSPELVAASGGQGSLRAPIALTLLIAVAASLVVLAALNKNTKLFAMVLSDSSRDELSVKARDVLDKVRTMKDPGDTARGFAEDDELVSQLARLGHPAEKGAEAENPDPQTTELANFAKLGTGEPAAMSFWYRESDLAMQPRGVVSGVTMDDPPVTQPGMSRVVLDVKGKLIGLTAIPTTGAGPAPADGDKASGTSASASGPADFAFLLDKAGLKPSELKSVPPRGTPPVDCDERVAWEGVYPDRENVAIHVEAGAVGGRPVYFDIRPMAIPEPVPVRDGAGQLLTAIVLVLALFGTPLGFALYHIRRGRGDRRGAMRLALVMLGIVAVQKLMGMHYGLTVDGVLERLTRVLGDALATAALAWLCYMAIEPVIRRQRPETIVSWSRLLSGSWRDPLVGRDLLIGMTIGCAYPLLVALFTVVSPSLGLARMQPQPIDVQTLSGLRQSAAVLLSVCFNALLFPLLILLLDAAVGRLIKHAVAQRLVGCAVLSIVFLAVIGSSLFPGQGVTWPFALLAVGTGIAVWFITSQFGLLMLVSAFFAAGVLTNFPVALGLPGWLAPTCLAVMVVIVGLSAFGFVTSLAGRKLFAGAMARA